MECVYDALTFLLFPTFSILVYNVKSILLWVTANIHVGNIIKWIIWCQIYITYKRKTTKLQICTRASDEYLTV